MVGRCDGYAIACGISECRCGFCFVEGEHWFNGAEGWELHTDQSLSFFSGREGEAWERWFLLSPKHRSFVFNVTLFLLFEWDWGVQRILRLSVPGGCDPENSCHPPLAQSLNCAYDTATLLEYSARRIDLRYCMLENRDI